MHEYCQILDLPVFNGDFSSSNIIVNALVYGNITGKRLKILTIFEANAPNLGYIPAMFSHVNHMPNNITIFVIIIVMSIIIVCQYHVLSLSSV